MIYSLARRSVDQAPNLLVLLLKRKKEKLVPKIQTQKLPLHQLMSSKTPSHQLFKKTKRLQLWQNQCHELSVSWCTNSPTMPQQNPVRSTGRTTVFSLDHKPP